MKFVVLKVFKFKWPEVNSAPNRQNKTKQKNITRQYTARFQYLHKISNPRKDEGIILQRGTLHCLWVPAHRQPKTSHSISDHVFCFVEPSEGSGDRRQPSFIKTWTQFHALSVRITTYQRTETIISFDV